MHSPEEWRTGSARPLGGWWIGVPVALALLAIASAAGGATRAPSGSIARSRCQLRAVQARARAMVVVAKRRYSHEHYGVVVHAALSRVAHDRRLMNALSAGSFRTAQREANRQLVRHTVRIRIARGSRTVVDANPSSFAVAGATGRLHGRGGRVLGQAEVSVQDIVGFIKLVHKYHPAHVLVRGRPGHVETSLPAARSRRLLGSGCVTVARHSYAVQSFHETGFAGERLTVWVLV